jgi:excisionase family DNA binding protein
MRSERRDPKRQTDISGGRRATDPRLLTTRDIADYLGVSTDFVVGEIDDGRLRALVLDRPGGRRIIRVSPASLEAFMRRWRWRPRTGPP